MAYYSDVNPGEAFKPVASLENELRHMVNARDGFRGSASAVNPQSLSVQVYNSTSELLEANIPVSFANGNAFDFSPPSSYDKIVPVANFTPGVRWGVLTTPLNPGEFGTCVVSGPVLVKFHGAITDDTTTLSPAVGGFIPGKGVVCLCMAWHGGNDSGTALVLLGANENHGRYIIGANHTAETIPAGTCVTLFPPDLTSTRPVPHTFVIKPGVVDPCGITLSDCPPGETVDVQISGLATVRTGTPLPPDVMIIPGYPFYQKSLVNINCPGNDLYRNYFKVSAVEFSEKGRISKVRIYDGGNPSSYAAGITDIGDVSTEELEYDFTPGTKIYIRLQLSDREDMASYLLHEFEINTYPYDGREPVVLLAEVSENNTIIQRWTGGQIFWRERFVIPFGRRRSTP